MFRCDFAAIAAENLIWSKRLQSGGFDSTKAWESSP
ncbi:hypothetical protein DSM3645_02478 [Blastopirellula marina DSM 3645]|uniref:Uncharacterized protein n=1 Tax=Blastopirellula marina DSM 3645 TaxID=314230 RepID=A3ZVF9_9BACT|nr:hypothetical protein DSM3645_02478 [Blastopirellula marina DSM 3645]